jgi:hypothetical protein
VNPDRTLLLARSPRLLVELPEVGAAFGTFWHELSRRPDGWQTLRLGAPFPHQWPTVGAGPGPLARATGAPVLAIWLAESTCGTFTAALPDGAVWSGHFPDCRGGSDHYEQCTLRLPRGARSPRTTLKSLVDGLLTFAAAAGLPLAAPAVEALFALDRPIGETALDLTVLLGFGAPAAAVVPPLFDHTEPDWMSVWYQGWRASAQLCGEWSWRLTGLSPADDPIQPTEAEAALIHFIERVAASMYGTGRSRADLAAEAAHLNATYLIP